MKLAILCGSVRMGRKSILVANHLVSTFEANPAFDSVELLDLADYNLPMMQERRGQHPNLPAAAEKLGMTLESADALVVVTPEYNGSYPGVLKNALDYYLDEYRKKPVGIVSVSSGSMGGNLAHKELSVMFMRIGAFVSPSRLYVSEVGKMFEEDGKAVGERYLKASAKFADEFAWFTGAIIGASR